MAYNNSSQILEVSPVIAAVKDWQDIQKAIDSPCEMVFVLFGNIMTISQITKELSQNGKMSFVHLDLIEGLSTKEVSVEFIKQATSAVGIITTKPQLIKKAKELGLIAVQRFFVLDSLALESTLKQIELSKADMIEILPGIMPRIIKEISIKATMPVIAGGLIKDKEDVINALASEASAVSTSNSNIWFL